MVVLASLLVATAYPPTIVRGAPTITGTAFQYAVTTVFAADHPAFGAAIVYALPGVPVGCDRSRVTRMSLGSPAIAAGIPSTGEFQRPGNVAETELGQWSLDSPSACSMPRSARTRIILAASCQSSTAIVDLDAASFALA